MCPATNLTNSRISHISHIINLTLLVFNFKCFRIHCFYRAQSRSCNMSGLTQEYPTHLKPAVLSRSCLPGNQRPWKQESDQEATIRCSVVHFQFSILCFKRHVASPSRIVASCFIATLKTLLSLLDSERRPKHPVGRTSFQIFQIFQIQIKFWTWKDTNENNATKNDPKTPLPEGRATRAWFPSPKPRWALPCARAPGRPPRRCCQSPGPPDSTTRRCQRMVEWKSSTHRKLCGKCWSNVGPLLVQHFGNRYQRTVWGPDDSGTIQVQAKPPATASFHKGKWFQTYNRSTKSIQACSDTQQSNSLHSR